MSDFEKLDTFFLGRPYDLAHQAAKPGLLLYDYVLIKERETSSKHADSFISSMTK